MASKELDNRALSLFCENMAMLLGAGIGPEEAAGLLCEDSADSLFHDAAQAVQISAYPDRYGEWEQQAYRWLAALG